MKNLYEKDDATYEVTAGALLENTIDEAIKISNEQMRLVSFNFNGVVISIRCDTEKGLILRDYNRAICGYINKNIGPHPPRVLTDEELINDARVARENENRRAANNAKYKEKARIKAESVAARLSSAREIDLVDDGEWRGWMEKNTNPYGARCFSYAQDWARLMQLEMDSGKKLEEVAELTSHEADTDGISGTMHGFAVSILIKCWKHGEELYEIYKR